ncbi:hypothetical protein PQ125_002606, partial [Salmonella enterica]|nr:hypothetical protein [Salmonella enterica]
VYNYRRDAGNTVFLEVYRNGAKIDEVIANNGVTRGYGKALEMPTGQGDVTLQFNVRTQMSSAIGDQPSWASDVSVTVMRKIITGIDVHN